MIDFTKPLELEDGTPVTYISDYKNTGDRVIVDIPSLPYSPNAHTQRVFYKEGVHAFKNSTDGIKLKLRNVQMRLVDVNKPVIVGGKEAKIVHQFDNGNMAVVVDGWAEVQNYNKYGQANGEGCIVLRNLAETVTAFYCIWNDLGVGSHSYKTKAQAEACRGNARDRYAGTLKLTLVDGIATSAEIV